MRELDTRTSGFSEVASKESEPSRRCGPVELEVSRLRALVETLSKGCMGLNTRDSASPTARSDRVAKLEAGSRQLKADHSALQIRRAREVAGKNVEAAVLERNLIALSALPPELPGNLGRQAIAEFYRDPHRGVDGPGNRSDQDGPASSSTAKSVSRLATSGVEPTELRFTFYADGRETGPEFEPKSEAAAPAPQPAKLEYHAPLHGGPPMPVAQVMVGPQPEV